MAVGVMVGLLVGVKVAEPMVITAPFKGAPEKLTAPVALDPVRSVTFTILDWKVPLALPEKLSATK